MPKAMGGGVDAWVKMAVEVRMAVARVAVARVVEMVVSGRGAEAPGMVEAETGEAGGHRRWRRCRVAAREVAVNGVAWQAVTAEVMAAEARVRG